jgi:methanogenic corrinoid protein MtbC1
VNSAAVLSDYMDGLTAGNGRRAMAVVETARRDGLDLRTLYLQVLQPALHEVGRRWEAGAMSVAEEHLATAVTQTVMSRLAGELFLQAPIGGPTVVAACVDDERHDVGLRMICDLLELEGWSTVYLGPTVPTRDLVRMVAGRRPAALALSVSLPPHLLAARDAITQVRRLDPPHPLVMVGGRALASSPDLAARLGADLTAADAGEAVALLKARFP